MSDGDELDLAINDPSQWDQPKRAPRSEKRRRDAVVSVRMTQEELEAVQLRASLGHQTVGTFIREAALSHTATHRLYTSSAIPILKYSGDVGDAALTRTPNAAVRGDEHEETLSFHAARYGWSATLTGVGSQ
jgi:hypothetical protein